MARKPQSPKYKELPKHLQYRGEMTTHGSGLQNIKSRQQVDAEQHARRAAILSNPSKKGELFSLARQVSMMKYESKIKGDRKAYAEGWKAVFTTAQLKAELAKREAAPKKRGRPKKVKSGSGRPGKIKK